MICPLLCKAENSVEGEQVSEESLPGLLVQRMEAGVTQGWFQSGR